MERKETFEDEVKGTANTDACRAVKVRSHNSNSIGGVSFPIRRRRRVGLFVHPQLTLLSALVKDPLDDSVNPILHFPFRSRSCSGTAAT